MRSALNYDFNHSILICLMLKKGFPDFYSVFFLKLSDFSTIFTPMVLQFNERSLLKKAITFFFTEQNFFFYGNYHAKYNLKPTSILGDR